MSGPHRSDLNGVVPMARVNTAMVQSSNLKLQAGIETHLLGSKPITIAGTAYKPSQIVRLLQREIDAIAAAESAWHTWIAKVRASKAIQRENAPTKRMLRALIVTLFGETSTVLADFGIRPRKSPKKLTVDE